MKIASDTVVTLTYRLSDPDGVIEESTEPVSYLHGGYDGIFPKVEAALDGKQTGDAVDVLLEPDDAFGEYDANLVRAEPKGAFPAGVEVGMQFEGETEAGGDVHVYTVTEIVGDQVMVDGNHPLAGKTLRFEAMVRDVRSATGEEVGHGHVHGEHGHHH